MTTSFLVKIDGLIDKVNKMFMSRIDFQNEIQELFKDTESTIKALHGTLTINSPIKTEISFGFALEDEPSDTKSMNLSKNTELKYKLWKKNGSELALGNSDEVNYKINELIKAYWKSDFRDKFDLLAFINEATYSIANQTIRYCLVRNKYFAVLFCDLDKFKQVNDTFGMDEGDRVINECAMLLEKAVDEAGVVIHRQAGGDEFIILYPTNLLHEILLLTENIFNRFNAYDFKLGDIKIGIAIGISFINRFNNNDTFKVIQDRSEKAVKTGKNIKLRGKYRFELNKNELDCKLSEFHINSAICTVKSNLDNPAPFNSPWLNMITSTLYTYFINGTSVINNESLNMKLSELIKHISPEIKTDILICSTNSDSYVNLNPEMSFLDIAFAVSFAIFRSRVANEKFCLDETKLRIKYSEKNSGIEIYSVPNKLLAINIGVTDELEKELDLGFFINVEDKKDERFTVENSFKRALLINIGHNPFQFSKEVFSDIIVIDDRPVRGGGLPDFWESTISRLISLVKSNPNIEYIYILGDQNFASKTIEKLKNIKNWQNDLEQLSYKTGQTISNINHSIKKLEDKIFFYQQEEELIANIAEIYKSKFIAKYHLKYTPTNLKNKILSRKIIMKSISLRNIDGCIVKSVKEAYPIVLEIARKSEDEAVIFDQAGQELKELIDFKVLLSDPLNDMIPSFYEKDKDSMEQYFQEQFMKPSGLFRNELNENLQYEAVVNHLVKIIDDPEKQFATRRAIFVIPHKIIKVDDISPLGLVSIRIIARFVKRRIILTYSFTWRTVEALVGFPYSLYGSVRFGQEITNDIKSKVSIIEIQKQIEMGEVSYIAHSLHIFMDEYGQNIAKRIVDEASD